MKITTVKYDAPGKYEAEILFADQGVQRKWQGIVDARKPGLYELNVTAIHTAPQTGGRITVRSVVGRDAELKLTGMIKIAKQAQEVDDFLELRVILLDKSARATAEPKLEIEADNVKASHAASVGKIDEEQILYLKSRGLTEERAKQEIVNGFLGN